MYILEKTETFEKWFGSLKDRTAKNRILARFRNVMSGTLGHIGTVGDGIFELKIDYGPGYRIYYTMKDNVILLLLIGGDKSKQDRDILKAKEIKKNLES
jgi:putative addiction module killer protein